MKYRLWFGDCLDRMGEIADGSIDMICCDLPYGTTQCKWDTIIPFEPLWAHYKRVIKANGAIVLHASQPFTSALVMSNPKWFRYCWIWEKSKATGHLDSKRRPLKAHEEICTFAAGQTLYNPQKLEGPPRKWVGGGNKVTSVYGKVRDQHLRYDHGSMRFPRSVVYFKTAQAEGKVLHSTQKPVALIEYLIRTYTNKGDMILDNCMGSGTTGVACKNLNRNFIGIEKDREIYEVARKRIKEHLRVTSHRSTR